MVDGRLPANTRLYFGEMIQERDRADRTRNGLDSTWGTFKKGADGLFILILLDERCPVFSCLRILAVIEVKSMSVYRKKLLEQIAKHVTRLGGGLKLGDTTWTPDEIVQPIDGPDLHRITVLPSKWRLSREWTRTKTESGHDLLTTERTLPPGPTIITEEKRNLWRVVLEWSQESLESLFEKPHPSDNLWSMREIIATNMTFSEVSANRS